MNASRFLNLAAILSLDLESQFRGLNMAAKLPLTNRLKFIIYGKKKPLSDLSGLVNHFISPAAGAESSGTDPEVPPQEEEVRGPSTRPPQAQEGQAAEEADGNSKQPQKLTCYKEGYRAYSAIVTTQDRIVVTPPQTAGVPPAHIPGLPPRCPPHPGPSPRPRGGRPPRQALHHWPLLLWPQEEGCATFWEF